MPVVLNITALKPSEIPPENEIIAAAKALIQDSLSWKLGKAYSKGLVQTAHALLPDGCSWHSRVSRHSLPFDRFWDILGHQWMPAKKAFNDQYIHEIKEVTLVKTLSPTASIWTIVYAFPAPLYSRIFTILQVTHLDSSTRSGWVVHLPIDLTGPGDGELLSFEARGVKGRYACVETITELADGRTEWRLVTANAPGGIIPYSLAEKMLPARIALDVTSFMDWYFTSYLKTHKFEGDPSLVKSDYSLSMIGWSLALVNALVYALAYHSSLSSSFPARTALGAIWVPGLYAFYHHRTKPASKDFVPTKDRLLIGMRDPMIPATIELAETLSLPDASALVTSRLLTIPRMSDRLVLLTSGAPYWEPCAKVDVAAHVHEHVLAPGSGYMELRMLLERLSKVPLDPSRPPWDIFLVQRPGGGSILFTRIHHAITDGRGVTDILIASADEPRVAFMPREQPPPQPANSLLGRLVQTASNVKDLRNLDRPAENLTSIKRAEPIDTVAMGWVQRPLDLAHLKHLAQRLGGGTVNDLVLAAVAGALRTHMRAQGDSADKAIQCKLPVDVFVPTLQTPDVVLGTHLGDLNVPLPINLETSAERYEQVHTTMRQAKAGYRSGLAAMMSGVVGGLATTTRLALIATDAKTVSCYVSNMKGPPAAIHLANGKRVANVRCHPLGLNNIGVAFAVYSYNGQVNLAVCTDRELIPDPDVLCDFLVEEFQQLAAAADLLSLRAGVKFLPWPPQFRSVYSVVVPHPIDAVVPVLFPADAPAISRFLVGTRDASIKVAADFTHHSTDYVRLDIRSAFEGDALPLLSELTACGGKAEDCEDGAAAPVLQRDCFTVIERVPAFFGLLNQTVTVKAWGVIDPARRIAAYETVVQGAGVRVWKIRDLEESVDEDGKSKTTVNETQKGVCPRLLLGVVSKDSVKSQRSTMDKYAAMLA